MVRESTTLDRWNQTSEKHCQTITCIYRTVIHSSRRFSTEPFIIIWILDDPIEERKAKERLQPIQLTDYPIATQARLGDLEMYALNAFAIQKKCTTSLEPSAHESHSPHRDMSSDGNEPALCSARFTNDYDKKDTPKLAKAFTQMPFG